LGLPSSGWGFLYGDYNMTNEQEIIAHLCRREGQHGATEDGVVMRACRAYLKRYGRYCFYWDSDVEEDLFSEACLAVCDMVARHFGKDAGILERLACSTAFNRCFRYYESVRTKKGRVVNWDFAADCGLAERGKASLDDLPALDRELIAVALEKLEGLSPMRLEDNLLSDDQWLRLASILDYLSPRREAQRLEKARAKRITMRRMRANGDKISTIASHFGTAESVISNAMKGKKRNRKKPPSEAA
jgi:hypothetical protein